MKQKLTVLPLSCPYGKYSIQFLSTDAPLTPDSLISILINITHLRGARYTKGPSPDRVSKKSTSFSLNMTTPDVFHAAKRGGRPNP